MSKTIVYEEGNQIGKLAPTAAPGGRASSGEPVLLGKLPAHALTDATDTVSNGGTCTLKFDGVITVDVKGETTTNAAIAAGDIVYYDGGVINADATNGVRYGYALDPVASGATTAIRVKVGY